jgi:hypothetical protein
MLTRELVITPCSLQEVRAFVETHHYSKSVNGVKITICYRVDHFGVLVGAVIYGQMSTTAWKKFGHSEAEVLELRRLVLVDEAPKNSESKVVGWTLRHIRKKLPNVNVVVSYADPYHGHTGVVYRASNFEYLGKSASDTGFYNPITNKTYHSRALRTKYNGNYKPFVNELRRLKELGMLQPVVLPGKHCYVYQIKSTLKHVTKPKERNT